MHKHKESTLAWTAFVAAIVGASVIAVASLSSPSTKPIEDSGAVLTQTSIIPTRILIPTIGVDAAVEQLGLAGDGTMATPQGPSDAAWYSPGTRPGDIGNAVIDGHSGWKDNIPAVFDNLYKLHIGDTIYVRDNTGTLLTFVVRTMRDYDPKADATNIFTSSDDKAHLNLITCDGVWNPVTQSSSKRLVIFADEVIK